MFVTARSLISATVLVAFLAMAPANAQQPPPQFQPYLNSPEYVQMIVAKVLAVERALKAGCDNPKPLGHQPINMLQMPTFIGSGGAPTSGAWTERIEVDRCGKHVFENVLVTFVNGSPKLTGLLPGTTRATPILQRDALTQAYITASVKQSAAERAGASLCADKTSTFVSETRFEKQLEPMKFDGSGKSIAGKWDETWMVQMCGRDIPVVMHFVADGKGGTIFNSSPRE